MKNKIKISGSTLKLIALFTMLIDHSAATILETYLIRNNLFINLANFINGSEEPSFYYILYITMRLIGRIAFPIYCFLLVQGFMHTKNSKKYILRIFLFALISEVPFDMAFRHKIFDFTYQNVFFTLLLGLVTISILDWLSKKNLNTKTNKYLMGLLYIIISFGGILAADLLKTDYSGLGVATILLIYFYRNKRVLSITLGLIPLIINSIFEITAILDILLVKFYNGKKGLKLKYIFYFFYPVHLVVLVFIRFLIWK